MALKAATIKPTTTAGPARDCGFRLVGTNQVQRRLIVLLQGETKTGHTHFALSAPGPIYYHGIDVGTEVIGGKHDPPWQDKQVWLASYDLSFDPDWNDVQRSQEASKLWNAFVANTREASQKARTEVIDYESDLWEMFRIARTGLANPEKQAYLVLSPEYRATLRHFYTGNQNLILLAKLKDEWKQNKSTGQRKRAGWGDADYFATVVCESWKRGGEYGVTILQCRMNPNAEGMEIPNDFATLAQMVFPDSSEEEWK